MTNAIAIPKNLHDRVACYQGACAHIHAADNINKLHKKAAEKAIAPFEQYYPEAAARDYDAKTTIAKRRLKCWSTIMHVPEVELHLGAEARQRLRASLDKDCPEFTSKNIVATLVRLNDDAELMFVNTLTYMDDKYKRNQPQKITKRFINNGAQYGYGANDTLQIDYNREDRFGDFARVSAKLTGQDYRCGFRAGID